MGFQIDPTYNEVADRRREFFDKYPDGRITAEIVPSPFDGFVCVKAYAWRTPDDPTPGTGLAWEPVPGKTPYTKDSELMNAETSAWGRAILATGASDAKKIASADEVRNRQGNGQPYDQYPGDKPDEPPAVASQKQVGLVKGLLAKLDDEKRAEVEQKTFEAYQIDDWKALPKSGASKVITRLKELTEPEPQEAKAK